MIAHPTQSSSIPGSAAILQLNCRRSPAVLNSLFNDPNTTNFLLLALQEPPVNSHTNMPSENGGWHLISSQPKDLSKASIP